MLLTDKQLKEICSDILINSIGFLDNFDDFFMNYTHNIVIQYRVCAILEHPLELYENEDELMEVFNQLLHKVFGCLHNIEKCMWETEQIIDLLENNVKIWKLFLQELFRWMFN